MLKYISILLGRIFLFLLTCFIYCVTYKLVIQHIIIFVFCLNILKKIGIKKIFFANKKSKFQPMNKNTRKKLHDYYQKDIKKLNKLIGQNVINKWEYN